MVFSCYDYVMQFRLLTLTCLGLLAAGCSDQKLNIEASTLTVPYVVALADGVKIEPLLTVGDSVNNKPDGSAYRLCGYLDGLGIYDNEDETFTLLMDHELRPGNGIARAHGYDGAFVSRWKIEKQTLRILHGEDLIKKVMLWNQQSGEYQTGKEPLRRLCSADLPDSSALFSSETGEGTREKIFFSGEEIYDLYGHGVGRAFAHIASGPDAGLTIELPRLGQLAHENVLLRPYAGTKTVAILLDDVNNKQDNAASVGQVYVYIGKKQKDGTDVEKAGLLNGTLFGVRIDGHQKETRHDDVYGKPLRFDLVEIESPEKLSGPELDEESNRLGVMDFLRPEDGAWNIADPRDFYFATTDRYDSKTKDPGYRPLPNKKKHPAPANQVGRSRLWQLRFDDPDNPESGGTITAVLDGREEHQMLDNLCVTRDGRYVMLQEDPGYVRALARIWQYDIHKDELALIAEVNPAYFTEPSDQFLTHDEETSGIIDASHVMGPGWFLLTAQAHYKHKDRELVQGGQLLAMYIP